MAILRDIKSGETYRICLCHQCDPSTYPRGKPIINDMNAKKDEKGNWVCSEYQTEDLNSVFAYTRTTTPKLMNQSSNKDIILSEEIKS